MTTISQIDQAIDANDTETPTMLAALVNTDANLTKLIRDVENFIDAAGIAALVKWQDSVRATIAKAVGDAP